MQAIVTALLIGIGLFGNSHIYAAQTVNYPNGKVEVVNDFQPPQDINPDPQQGGDGYRPIPTEDKVYAIYHHSYRANNMDSGFERVDASCIVKSTGQFCSGFPKAIKDGSDDIISENGSSTGVVDYKKMKVYFGAAKASSTGIMCLDLISGNECGYTITDSNALVGTPWTWQGSYVHYEPNINVFPFGNEVDFDNFDGTIHYSYLDGTDTKVGCKVVDASYGGSCPVSSITYASSSTPDYKTSTSYGERAYIVIYDSSNLLRVVCYDKAANNDCGSGSTGWNSGKTFSSGRGNQTAFYIPSLNKVCVGLTYSDSSSTGEFSCINPSDGTHLIDSSGDGGMDVVLNNVFHAGEQNNAWFPSYIKNKLYIPDRTPQASKDMYCWDNDTNSECPEFSGGIDWSSLNSNISGEPEDYAYTGDRYTNYRCAWALGDAGRLIPFRLDGATGTAGCLGTSTNLNIDLSDYLCKPELGLIESVSIENINMTDVDYADVAFTDQDSNPLSIGGNSSLDLKALGGQKIYSPQVAGLTYISVNGSLVLNTLSNWNSGSPPVLKLVINPNGSALISTGCTTTKKVPASLDANPLVCDVDRHSWLSVDVRKGIDNANWASLQEVKLTLKDVNGNVIPGFNAIDASSGSIDISSLSTATYPLLNAEVEYKFDNNPTLSGLLDSAVEIKISSLPADNLIASNCPVDLTADKTSNFSQLADTAGVGTEFEYTLTFTNNGPNDAYNARVTDTLPANNILELSGANPFSYTTSPASTTVSCSPASSTTGFTCDINKLIALTKDPAAKVEVKVKVKLAQAYLTNYLNSPGFKTGQDFSLHDAIGNLTNTVSIATGNHPKTNQPQAETDLTNNQDTVTDQPQAADIELVKLVSPINTAGNPILTSNAGAGWETPYQRYVTSTGQVYVSQDIVPGAEGWDVAKLDYMIFVINRGPNTQKAVKVQDVRSIASGNLPSIDLSYGVKEYALTTNPNYSTATLQGSLPGISAGSTTIDWPVGDMTSGYAEALFYRTDYSSGTGDYTNFAQNTTEGADRDPDSNSDNCNIQDSLTHEDDCDEINVSKNMASLTINKSASPTEVTGANQDVTYTIVIANNGSLDYASNEYSVDDTLPEGLDYVSSTPTGKCNYDSSSRKISCSDLGPLPAADAAAGTPAGSVTITINTKTNESIISKTNLANVACVKPTTPTVGLTNGQLCDDANIHQESVDLELTKEIVGSSGIYIGDSFQYKIALTNKGPGVAKDVVIKETYPPSVEFVSAAPEVGSYDAATHQWTVPQIGVGQTINLLINAKALEYKDGDNTKNLAEVTGCKQGATSSLTDCDDPYSDMNNCQNGANKEDDCGEAEFHEPIHDIVLTKSIANQKESYSVGDTVEYLITVTNNGPDTAKRMVFKDTLPAEVQYLYSESPDSTVYNATTHEWYVRSLAAGQSLQLKVVVKIKQFTSTIVNLVEWTGCKDEAGKEVRCGKDPDSTPNNCNNGTNKEDDCDQKDIKLSGGKGVGVPITGALVGKIIAGATGIALVSYLGRDIYARNQKKRKSER
jgi:uncharacterized repeat protein (TIGR01451 family)